MSTLLSKRHTQEVKRQHVQSFGMFWSKTKLFVATSCLFMLFWINKNEGFSLAWGHLPCSLPLSLSLQFSGEAMTLGTSS